MRLFFSILLIFVMLTGTASAITDYHIWDEQNQTATLYKNQQKWITVTNIGIVSDITEHRELLKVTSNYDYFFSALDDFYMGYEIYKGNNKITDLSTTWFLRTTENYNVTVDDYGIVSNQTSKEVFNNQTGINETVWYWDNQTVITGNHTEARSRVNESLFTPTNKKIDAGQTLTFIKVTRKRAEVGEFSILLKPVFMGVSIKELTWWNATWLKKKPILLNNTGNATVLTDYQVFLNITYDSDMQADFDDIRIVNDTSGIAVSYWIESKVNSSYANIWFNASSIPASVWTNSTFSLYYSNPSAASASSGTNTFLFFDDFEGTGLLSWTNNAGTWVNDGGYRKQTSTIVGDLKISYINISETDYIVHAKFKAITSLGANTREGLATEKSANGVNWMWGTLDYINVSRSALLIPGVGWFGLTAMGFTAVADTWYDVNMLRQANVQKVSIKPVGQALVWQTQTTQTSLANKIAGLGGGYETVVWYDDFYVRKYASPEPTATLGTEETPTPVTFNQSIYNTGWQTIFINSTQNMTSIRSMMNSSNVLWVARWNATSQKFETYKAGWTYRATNNASAGDAIYLKVTNNDTVTRNNGTGSYNWNLSTKWNLIGMDYNSTRTLSQINTSVNSVGNCEANLITYINPVNMTEYIYTCGSANNASVAVAQGQGVWMNATTAISRVRSW